MTGPGRCVAALLALWAARADKGSEAEKRAKR